MKITIDQATEIFRKNYEKWLQEQQHQTSGYEYEKSYVEMMQHVSREVLESSIEKTGKGRKKNSRPA